MNDLTEELLKVEAALQGMRPAGVHPRLRARLEDAFSSVFEPQYADELEEIQNTLSIVSPGALPNGLMDRLEMILSRVPHPDTHKVLSFPEPAKPTATPAWKRWGAAAAVAVLGIFSAFMVPADKAANTRSQTVGSFPQPRPISSSSLVPASYRTGLSEARDEGIVWQENSGPQRILKLVYMDHVTLTDSQGQEVQVERPRVRYILVPAHID